MKFNALVFMLLLAMSCVQVHAAHQEGGFEFHGRLFKELRISGRDIAALESHPAIIKYKLKKFGVGYESISELVADQDEETSDPIADYETQLPHATQPRISPFERAVLTAYLENPGDVQLAKFLAIYHLSKSLLLRHHRNGRVLAHTIIAEYFLHRVVALGDSSRWVAIALNKTGDALENVLENYTELDGSQYHDAHKYFINAFNYNEQNRYRAVRKLLDDVLVEPGSVLTSAYLTASNIWVGGEAGYEDPTVLYSFVLSSYFSVRTVAMAKQMELNWMSDPDNNERFRLASILGGWTVPARRWLAKLHQDHDVIAALDAEHRQWLTINRAFHSASVGLMMFDEPENFWEGFAAWQAGFDHCAEVINFRSCIDRPRFSFNLLSFILGGVDYLLKAGMVNEAQNLMFVRYNPFFQYENWDLGRDAWEHRENNLQAIADLYQNDNPDDDPTHFLLKKRKWGPSTITCQTCHQAQSRQWSEDEINTVQLPHESVRTIGTWPDETTTWYAALKQ